MAETLLIKNALAIGPHGRRLCSILVAEGRIAALLRPTDGPSADLTIDVDGRPVIPGAIDPHVHLEMGGQTFEEDVATETRGAVIGGVTTFLHFMSEPGSYFDWYERYRRGVEQHSLIDFAFHVCITSERHLAELPRYVEELQISSLKYFMAYRGAVTVGKFCGVDDGQLFDALRASARYPHVVNMIHCENVDISNREAAKLQANGKADLAAWADCHPPISELEGIQRAAILGQETGATMYVVHMSVGRAPALLANWQDRYPRLFGETCNSYLALDQTRVIRSEPEANAALLKVNPPLRTPQDVALLWQALAAGRISTVASDHAGYTEAFKGRELWKATPGLNGTGMIIPVLLTEGVARGRISLEQVVAVSSYNAARIFGLYPRKGAIELDSDADLVVLDPEREVTITSEVLHSVCDWSPYEGYRARGWPVTTIVHGRIVQHEGKIVDDGCRGRVLVHGAYGAPRPATALV